MSTAETTDLAPRLTGDEPAPPRPQYMTGFDGMASEPFPEAARKVLAEPPAPEAVEIKPNGIVFVPGVYYRRQLTRAFGAGGWALAPRSPARVMGNIVAYHGALFCLGRFVAEAVGECAYRANNDQMSYASALEGAKTDALSRCCKDLGMATQLWDKEWRDRWMADYAEKGNDGKWRARSGRPVQDVDLMAGAGGAAPKGPAPSAPASAPAATPSPATAAAPVDAGEPASDADKKEIRAFVKQLGWVPSKARTFLGAATGGKVIKPDELSAAEARMVLMLLEGEVFKLQEAAK
jgi:ribonuclease HI